MYSKHRTNQKILDSIILRTASSLKDLGSTRDLESGSWRERLISYNLHDLYMYIILHDFYLNIILCMTFTCISYAIRLIDIPLLHYFSDKEWSC
jgi:hypothetical protein